MSLTKNIWNGIGKGKYKSCLWHSHFVNSMIFPLVFPDKIKYNSLLPWISLFMGTDNIKFIKHVKSLVFLMSITKVSQILVFFLKIFDKKRKVSKFCKLFWNKKYQCTDIHFFHYWKTCIKWNLNDIKWTHQ